MRKTAKVMIKVPIGAYVQNRFSRGAAGCQLRNDAFARIIRQVMLLLGRKVGRAKTQACPVVAGDGSSLDTRQMRFHQSLRFLHVPSLEASHQFLGVPESKHGEKRLIVFGQDERYAQNQIGNK